MEFHGTVQNGQHCLPIPLEKLRQRYLQSMKDGTPVKMVLTRISPHKTHQQVKTIFGLVIARILDVFEDNGWDSSILLNTEKPTGVPVSKVLLKEYFYAVCPICDSDGNRITLSKAKIDKAAQFIDETRNFAATQWSIDVPDPDPNWREKKVTNGED